MTSIRYTLIGFSVISAVVLSAVWAFSGYVFDATLLIFIVFLIANSFYVYLSRPIVKTSDILGWASTNFAMASLNLRYQAREAHIRELEAKKRQLEEAAQNQYKLQVAKEMLQHLRPKSPPNLTEKMNDPQIGYEPRLMTNAVPLPSPALPKTVNTPPSSTRDTAEAATRPAALETLGPSSTIYN